MSKLSPTAFRDQVAAFTDTLRRRIDAEVSGFPTDPRARAVRVAKVKDPATGFRFFCETYFPHYLTKAPNRLHLHLFAELPAIVERKPGGRGAREIKIAPRGAAKSTIVTQLFTLWTAILKLRRYAIVGMDVYDQAAIMLAAIKVELEENPRLAQDFPDAVGQGRLWREGEIVLRNGVKIEAVGSRQKVRGRRHGPYRPDLFILDDIENDENVRSPDYRDKLEAWVLKAVLKCGPADGSMDLIIVGTLLMRDAVLVRLAKRPGWNVEKFASIVEWPDRMDLWDEWEEYHRNASEAASDAFYAEHKVEMDAGAVVNWPEEQPLLMLMKERAESPAAFKSERQNDPVSETAPFQKFTYWVREEPDLVRFGAIDPSLGKKSKRNDPSAIIVGGYNRQTGVLDILKASIRRRLPDVICEDTIALQREFNCALWFCEAVQFQEFLRTEIMRRAAVQGVALSALPVTPIVDKRLRIERLQPPVASGLIRFWPHQKQLIDQLEQFPDGEHDDGPDCLEMLWSGALQYAGVALEPDAVRGANVGVSRDFFGGYRL
ncbi:MAG: phage terminase large subunit [Hyphomicrobiales bacterium]|nr:phage terminase large subunit [Hyphomicrobiales bacterium]